MITPGQTIPIDDKTRDGLAIELTNLVRDLESEYSGLFSDITTWWKNYEATPRIQGPKNFPFVGASNVVVPLIQITADATVNRAYATVHGHGRRIWLAKTQNEEEELKVDNIARYINWAANNNDFNMRLVAYDWFLEAHVIGSSVIALNWREDRRWVYAPGTKEPVEVEFAKGAFPEHVPREQILWDTAFLIQDAALVVREFTKTWSELQIMAAQDDSYNKEAIEKIRGKGSTQDRPSEVVARSRDTADSKREFTTRRQNRYDIREISIDWPLLGELGFKGKEVKPNEEEMGVPSLPIVVTLDMTSQEILRIIAQPYNLPYKPFFDIFYRKRAGRGHSVGISKKLEHMQIAMTTSLNQALDARTRSNSVWATTNRKEFLTKPINPAHPIYRPTDGSFEPFALTTGGSFDDERLMRMVQVIAERQTGQSDPALGRDTRQGGHPSPARTTEALLQQTEIMSGTTNELIRIQYSRLGEAIASLYQQFDTDPDRVRRVLGEQDAEQVGDYLFPTDPVIGNIHFDLVSFSGNFNPETEMQKAVTVSQINMNYWSFVLRAMEVISNPELPALVRMGAVKSIQAQTKVHMRVLETQDIDDLDAFVLALGNAQDPSHIREAAGIAEEIAGASGGVQGQPVGGGGGVAPGGAPGASNGPGGLF